MAKKTQSVKPKQSAGTKKTFEERLERLEELGDEIRKTDIPLDEAIKAFEEGIVLARALEKDLEKVESRIEILMNGPDDLSEDDSSSNDDVSDDEEASTDDASTDAPPAGRPALGLFDEG